MCQRHKHCAYSGSEPGLCPVCHATTAKCGGKHGLAPADGSWKRGALARPKNPVLHEGQYLHPMDAVKANSPCPQPRMDVSESEDDAA